MAKRWLWAALTAAAISLAGCTGSAPSASCDGPCTCSTDTDCTASLPRCDKNTSTCVACLPKGDNCPVGQHCVDTMGSYACVAACGVDADCPKSPAGTQELCCAGACFVVDSDAQNCGGCGRVCTPPVNGVPACKAGVCGLGACAKGYADCNQNAADGCEIRTDTDSKNCGACGTVCPSGPNQTTSCVAGACTPVCAAGWSHCSMNAADGCEVHSDVDLKNCGGCGVVCGPLANASAVCTTGKCAIQSCTGNYADCDKNPTTGCEAPLDTDVNNCGVCGMVCAATANSTPGCASSVCVVSKCAMGFADCDGLYKNGCEVSTVMDANNCGVCSHVCGGYQSAQDCELSACTITSCNAGYADCDHLPATGCEISTHTDIANCGGCGMACAVPANVASVVCGNAVCGIGACVLGFANCNMMVGDGCEINLQTDPKNCSACSNVCMVPNAVAGCAIGKCTVGMCNMGYADCNKMALDGCEINTQTDPNNCSGCGKPCALANAVPGCAAGVCTIKSCAAGFADCDGKAANGCEVNLQIDANNCGKCGAACGKNTPYCDGSRCSNEPFPPIYLLYELEESY